MQPMPGPPYKPRVGADSLILLGDKLPQDLREQIGQKLQGMMPRRHDQLAHFVRALAVVWSDTKPLSRNAALDEIVKAVRNPPPPNTFDYAILGEALAELGKELSKEESMRTFVASTIGTARTDDSASHKAFAECLTVLAATLDVKDLAALLRYPTCVGEYRQIVLAQLEEKAGRQFDNDRWQAAASFDGLGFTTEDLHRPPVLIPAE